MYFVNRSEIEETLTYMDTLLAKIKDNDFSSQIEKLGLERLIHMTIESIIDVGNMMIDGFIMRDPGSYHDIIDILVDEKVIPENDEKNYKQFIDLREILMQNYLTVDHNTLLTTLRNNEDVLLNFSKHVRVYLKNELGVANAFSNEQE